MAVEETAGGIELAAAIFVGGAACGSPADGVQIAHGRSLRVELAERGVEPRGVGVVEAEHAVFLVGEATAGLRLRFISGEQAAYGGGIQVLAEVIRGARALRPAVCTMVANLSLILAMSAGPASYQRPAVALAQRAW